MPASSAGEEKYGYSERSAATSSGRPPRRAICSRPCARDNRIGVVEHDGLWIREPTASVTRR